MDRFLERHVPMTSFDDEVADKSGRTGTTPSPAGSGARIHRGSTAPKYSYNFAWLGRPIIQYPQDIVAMQELIWRSSQI